MEAGLIGKACAKRAALSCREITLEALGLNSSMLDIDKVRCALVQPILDNRSSKVLAVICAVNKRSGTDAGQSALFSEPKYTLNDV